MCAVALTAVTACNNGSIDTAGTGGSTQGTGGSTAAGGNVVEGTPGGAPFDATDATSFQVGAQASQFNGPSTGLVITAYPGACAAATAGNKALGAFIAISLASLDAGGAASPASLDGTYTVVTAAPAHAGLVAQVGWLDGEAMSSAGTSGSVTVTKIGQGGIEGTFDVVFDDGGKVTGSFDAASCPGFSPQ